MTERQWFSGLDRQFPQVQLAFFTPLFLMLLDSSTSSHRTTPLNFAVMILRNPMIVGSALGLLVGVSLAGALWTLWERSRHDPWLRLLERAQHRLQKAGVPVAPTMPPRQLASAARSTLGDRAQAVAEVETAFGAGWCMTVVCMGVAHG